MNIHKKLGTALIAVSMVMLGASVSANAAEVFKPFTFTYNAEGDMAQAVAEAKAKVTAAGFEVVGEYAPYAGATIIAVTSGDLKKAAASTEFGGYAAAQRVTVTEVGGKMQVSYTNPAYYGAAYRIDGAEGKASLVAAQNALSQALGAGQMFGTGDKQLTEADLQKYHYMIGMEYFDDPSDLMEYDSQKEAIAAVEAGLASGKGGATKVYRIDIPGKEETVFGVALTDAGCSGDEYIMSRIDKDDLRSTGHLPYEILVSDGNVYALYARFRIAISWPHLPMIQNATGATFFNIMCAPNAIEEALIQAAGGEV
ncbi:MAG: hypothetical protein A2408_02455 [Candidatus Yonathbacteria bacterium RIFOXYC1_FULL_52_10]|uniref:Uncharacterized protein n=1 Tax=Candidatus Yonathbacteria bacterium RIFOXYD1_FULL_52_36 TaxID=1802730 RepID=A0A1G2SK36_9BACT|nr:MAG: hypothetical protein A2408_02455 [Candidatus Yonathbacteria bacterium RIFOXYC1_FULL_52_10]OHA85425.1 MAG: hypothetical protein A2591_03030 [Candidatus Yonathbacteria bacterium RIFOXYD1_FULL_52_36]